MRPMPSVLVLSGLLAAGWAGSVNDLGVAEADMDGGAPGYPFQGAVQRLQPILACLFSPACI